MDGRARALTRCGSGEALTDPYCIETEGSEQHLSVEVVEEAAAIPSDPERSRPRDV